MEKIKNQKVLEKYLKYLLSFSDQLLSKSSINYADFEQLVIENNLFHSRCKDSINLAYDLIETIESIKLTPIYNTGKSSIFNFFLSGMRLSGCKHDLERLEEEEYRNKILHFQNQILNLLSTLSSYYFYK